jgi:hypothetical protein
MLGQVSTIFIQDVLIFCLKDKKTEIKKLEKAYKYADF